VRAKGREVRSRFLDRPLYAGTTIPAERRFPVNLSKTRVKVPRTTLIERIQNRIDEATKQHDDAVAEYDKEVAEFLASLPTAIEKRAKDISKLKGDEARRFVSNLRADNYEDGKVWIKVEASSLPKRSDDGAYEYLKGDRSYWYDRHDFEGYIKELKKALKVLEASTDEFISVAATDQYADWL
jgi:hypothetical protein